MFFEVERKIVRPIIPGNEIKVRNRGRVDGSQKGIFARIADGGGGKSCNTIRVIRSGPRQIFSCQIPVEVFDSIDHGGITLKGNLLF
jgi:hypothetical protein